MKITRPPLAFALVTAAFTGAFLQSRGRGAAQCLVVAASGVDGAQLIAYGAAIGGETR